MTLKNNFSDVTSNYVQHFVATSQSKLELQSGNAQFGSILAIFVLCDFEIWQMTVKNNTAPLLTYFKLCASFRSHCRIQIGVTVRRYLICVKIGDFFVACDLEIWGMTLKNNRAPILCYFKLCASFRNHLWIQTVATVWKRTVRVKICDLFLCCATLKFDRWPSKTTGHLS